MSDSPMKKQALLIGINEYQILPGLKYARQDAEAVANSLRQNYCFSDNEVMLLTDARPGLFKPTNRYIIEDHLEKLANQELDLFIFGFWGHGLFRNGKRYLCPLDVMTARAERQGLPFDELQELLANIHAKNTCLILDCCQTIHDRGEAETLTASDKASMENAARDIVFRRKTQIPNFQSNVAILNSCKEGQSAYEWDARQHGLFTAHLLDAMNIRCTSVLQIVSYISSNIEKTAMELGKEQTPFYKIEGDIHLPYVAITWPLETDDVSPLATGDVFVSYGDSIAKWSEISQDKDYQKPTIENKNTTVPPAQIEQSQPIQDKKLSPTSRSSFKWNETKIIEFIGKETEVVIPESTTVIGEWAFRQCSSLISVVIPKGVKKIEQGAFCHCSSLTSVIIPDSVRIIKPSAFIHCTALKKWMISSSHPYFKRDGVGLLTKDGKKLVACLASAKTYHIPKGVTEIGVDAFRDCSSLTSVVIPKSVTEIGEGAFRNCRYLTFVAIPEGVTEIGGFAFINCSSLTSMVIPEGVTEIGDGAFSGCSSLTSVVIPRSVRKIGQEAFKDCPVPWFSRAWWHRK